MLIWGWGGRTGGGVQREALPDEWLEWSALGTPAPRSLLTPCLQKGQRRMKVVKPKILLWTRHSSMIPSSYLVRQITRELTTSIAAHR